MRKTIALQLVVLLCLGCIGEPMPSAHSDAADDSAGPDASSDEGDGSTPPPDMTSISDQGQDAVPDAATLPGAWCAHASVGDEAVEITALGATGDLLHAVGRCVDGNESCWFVGDVSTGQWSAVNRFADTRAPSFLDVDCAPDRCFSVNAQFVHASDGSSLQTLVGPALGSATFTAVGAGSNQLALADTDGRIWFRDAPTSSWSSTAAGAVSDFTGQQGLVQFAIGANIWQLTDGVWAPTDLAMNMNHGSVADDTLFVTGGNRFAAINTGFTRSATLSLELGRVSATAPGDRAGALIAAGNRILLSDGGNPIDMPVGETPSAPFAGVAHTSAGVGWAITEDGTLYAWQAEPACP